MEESRPEGAPDQERPAEDAGAGTSGAPATDEARNEGTPAQDQTSEGAESSGSEGTTEGEQSRPGSGW